MACDILSVYTSTLPFWRTFSIAGWQRMLPTSPELLIYGHCSGEIVSHKLLHTHKQAKEEMKSKC